MFLASSLELSLSLGILIPNGSFLVFAGLHVVVGIFSILFMSMLVEVRRLFMGTWCHLIFNVPLCMIVLYSGCSGGSIAIQVIISKKKLVLFLLIPFLPPK